MRKTSCTRLLAALIAVGLVTAATAEAAIAPGDGIGKVRVGHR